VVGAPELNGTATSVGRYCCCGLQLHLPLCCAVAAIEEVVSSLLAGGNPATRGGSYADSQSYAAAAVGVGQVMPMAFLRRRLIVGLAFPTTYAYTR
jgi:hypothetical protein